MVSDIKTEVVAKTKKVDRFIKMTFTNGADCPDKAKTKYTFTAKIFCDSK